MALPAAGNNWAVPSGHSQLEWAPAEGLQPSLGPRDWRILRSKVSRGAGASAFVEILSSVGISTVPMLAVSTLGLCLGSRCPFLDHDVLSSRHLLGACHSSSLDRMSEGLCHSRSLTWGCVCFLCVHTCTAHGLCVHVCVCMCGAVG